ncbi:hypothetical protein ACVWZ4_003628 [Bradyrhizobium sp. USDA 4472]
MTINPLCHQSLHRASHWQLGIGNLALDDGVKVRVRFRPRQADPGAAMVIHRGVDGCLLVQRKPLVGIWLRTHERFRWQPPQPQRQISKRCDLRERGTVDAMACAGSRLACGTVSAKSRAGAPGHDMQQSASASAVVVVHQRICLDAHRTCAMRPVSASEAAAGPLGALA